MRHSDCVARTLRLATYGNPSAGGQLQMERYSWWRVLILLMALTAAVVLVLFVLSQTSVPIPVY